MSSLNIVRIYSKKNDYELLIHNIDVNNLSNFMLFYLYGVLFGEWIVGSTVFLHI